MNNLNEKIGISSSLIIIVGCLLKAFHLQGAVVVLTSGFLFFCLIFMPSIIFSQLKEKKIIVSVKGKGYYTAKTDLISKVNVFFLVNKPSTYKMMIYNSFVNTIGVNGHVNLFIYHCDEILFKRSLERNIGAYDYYVIMPHFRDENSNHVSYTDEVLKLMEQIPKDQLILLDNTKPHIKGDYGSIYQDFQKDKLKVM